MTEIAPTGWPAPVRRFVHRPLPWLALALIWSAVFFLSDVAWVRGENRRLDERFHVAGAIAESETPGGSHSLRVTYRHPVSGERVDALVTPSRGERPPAPGGTVALRVDRDNALDVKLANDRQDVTVNLPVYGAWIALPLGFYLIRRRHMRRIEELVRSTGPTFSMLAGVSRPRHLGWRWRLHLYALDARLGTDPVCTLVLIGSRPKAAAPGAPLFPVEVKGLPRPFGRIVVRTRPDGDVLWPTGRALRR